MLRLTSKYICSFGFRSVYTLNHWSRETLKVSLQRNFDWVYSDRLLHLGFHFIISHIYSKKNDQSDLLFLVVIMDRNDLLNCSSTERWVSKFWKHVFQFVMDLFGIRMVVVDLQRCFDRLKTILKIALLESDRSKTDVNELFDACRGQTIVAYLIHRFRIVVVRFEHVRGKTLSCLEIGLTLKKRGRRRVSFDRW